MKDFAREAKLRLVSNRNNRRSGYQAHSYELNSRVLTEAEVGEIYERMLTWMEVSPCDILLRLANTEELSTLDDGQKAKYMLQLANIYRSLRDEYERQHQISG